VSQPKASRWIKIFKEFSQDLRINSKEEISDDDRGIPLVLWESQKRFLEFVGDGLDQGIRQFYCLKSRQLGLTTISLAIDIFWLAMHKNLTCALVTENEKNRDKNRAILRKYVNSFPPSYFGESFHIIKGGDNRNSMRFSNGSRIDFLVAGVRDKGTSWGEGEGYAFAHLTECAAYGSAEGLDSFEEAFAQTNPNRLFIYESTAKGPNHWQDRYLKAEADPYTKRALFVGWWSGDHNRIEQSDPRFLRYGGYAPSGEEREKVAAVAHLYGHKITPEQLAWIRWREDTATGDAEAMLLQNQPWTASESFILTGFSFFQNRTIGQAIKTVIDAPEAPVSEGGYGFVGYRYELEGRFFDIKLVLEEENLEDVTLRIWEEPVADAQYVIGFDPAWGRNPHGDRHAISVWRCFADKLVQVAEYADKDVEMKHATWVCAHLAGAYNNVIVNFDVNGPGQGVFSEWDSVRGQLNAEMNDELVRARDWENALGQARWYLYHRPDSMGAGYAYAYQTSGRGTEVLMHGFRGAYVSGELVIRSLPMLYEMTKVVQDGASIGAPESSSADCKDDRVFAAALAQRAWADWVKPGMIAQGLTYERSMKTERGEITKQTQYMNSIVSRFFLTQQQKAEMTPDRPQWQVDRGL
jgi:hypothetical protein